jgi:hypothetical protein
MSFDWDYLNRLAARVRQHDAAAATQLRAALEPGLVFKVRWLWRTRECFQSVDRHILNRLDELPDGGRELPPEEQKRLTRQLAADAAAQVVDDLWNARGPSHALRETVWA